MTIQIKSCLGETNLHKRASSNECDVIIEF
jgi:hypothetical protein